MTDKGNINELSTLLDQWGKNLVRPCILIDGIIKSVDETALTCSIEVNSATFNDVPLKVITNTQSSFIEIPKVNTDCLLRFKDNNIQCPQLISVHECDKILIKVGESVLNITDGLFEFNGGNNYGLMKIQEVISWMQKVHADLTTLQSLLSTSPVAGNGAPLAIVFSPTTPTPIQSTLEDTKVKH